MAVKIPEPHRAPLVSLAMMLPASRKRLIDALKSVEPMLDSDDLTTRIAPATEMDKQDLGRIVRMLISMILASEGSREEFVEEVVSGAQRLIEGSEKSEVDWKSFSGDLLQLLALEEGLGLSAKASSVLMEYGRVLCDARVLTDIRPIFASDPTHPRIASIIHSLRITYHEGKDHKEFHVALRTSDLRDLLQAIERAFKKEISLRGEIEKTRMRYLSDERDT